MVRQVLVAALGAALLAGLFAAVFQSWQVMPLLAEGERYEEAGAVTMQHGGAAVGPSAMADPAGRDLPRIGLRFVTDIVVGFGFALVLGAAMTLQGARGWRQGLLWGLAGFAVFALAPGLGLPPAVPGAAEAYLGDRQIWWLATAGATAAGLALVFLDRRPLASLAGLALLALPHAWGAPQAGEFTGAAPLDLGRRFAQSSLVGSFLFWSVLGATEGVLFARFVGDGIAGPRRRLVSPSG